MDQELDRGGRLLETIRALLLREWDPIGIASFPEARHEYDHYAVEIYAMLAGHESKQRLFEHLWWIETKHMGLCGDRRNTEAFADRLFALRDEIERREQSL